MRPIKLTMTGFESYKDKTVINFEELGTKGLYLITGDTGAGKTTIFDAITFALYGSPSGSDRSVEMLRSHFADENTPTEVELYFEANGNKYIIKRNPDYERKSLRGDGVTKEAANATLEFITKNQDPITSVSKVNAEIEKILNLRKDQFCRIAMIAQGRFQELLLSKKEQKQTIFRELFHTEKYERIQETLKADRNQANYEVENLKKSLKSALERIQISEADKNSARINQIITSVYVTQDEIDILKKFVADDENLLSQVIQQIKELESQLEAVNNDIQTGETRKKLSNQIEIASKNHDKESEQLKIYQAAYVQAQENAKNVPELDKEKTLLEASLKEYEEISVKDSELQKLRKDIAADSNQNDSLEKEKQKLDESISALKKEKESLKNAGEKIGTYEAGLIRISEDKKELNEICSSLEKYLKDKEKLTAAQEAAKKAISNYEAANHEYSEKFRLFNLEQAGILAETLSAGCPCPVCGSTEHPHPAEKSENAPSQKELEDSKKTMDKLQQVSVDFSGKAKEIRAVVENSQATINKMLGKYFENLTVEDEAVSEKINAKLSALENEYDALDEKLSQEKNDKARSDKIEKEIPECEERLKGIQNNLTQLIAQISSNQAIYETEEKNLTAKKAELKYATLLEAQNKFKELENQINKLTSAVDAALMNKNDCEKTLDGLEGEAKGLTEQLSKTKAVDVEKLEVQKKILTDKKDVLENQRDSINKRNGINQESVNTIEKLVPEISAANDRLAMISSLCEVALGSSRGKNGKPSLETYVQMHCLDQINRRANLRLKTMTENKYELRRRIEEDGAELGLDLNVKDFYTGRERNVHTLSGGEQFQASLALALGLADEIQESAGGIRLDTMFIDEGFGTLDSETLNKAMRALEDLSQGNKLIGIISHVEELEARIPKQISVKKDETGVSHIQIVKD